MNKTEFIEKLAETAGLTKKDAGLAVNAISDVVIEALNAGDKVTITGFGTFEVVEREARTGHNPQTGEPMEIPAGKAPKFRPGKQFRDAIRG